MLRATTSTYHLLVKFPTEYSVGEARKDQATARECYVAMLGMDEQLSTMSIEDQRSMVEPMEKLEEVNLDDDHSEKVIRLGTRAGHNSTRATAIPEEKHQCDCTES